MAIAKKSAVELREIDEEFAYWQVLADILGWKVAGWNRKAYCTYRKS